MGAVLRVQVPSKGGHPDRSEHALGIVRICFDQDVEILGRTGVPVERDRVAAKHYKASACIVQLDKDVAKVVKELDHARVRGTKRTGTPLRACPALAIPARLKLDGESRG